MLETAKAYHEPVLLQEVLAYLVPRPKGIYVDGTVGLAGHSRAILEASAPDGFLYGFEWNEDTYLLALERLKPYEGRFKIFRENFVNIPQRLREEGVLADGVLLDLGLSSFLLEGSGRGFTYKKNEPLDMRMNLSLKLTAKDVLNSYSFPELCRVFASGEVPKARTLAKAICEYRKRNSLEMTVDLIDVVKALYKGKRELKDLLAVIFQSLRLEVNRELENLAQALREIPEILKPGGRLAIISFHSLEDRLVKQAFKNEPRLRVLTKKPVIPTKEEINKNPRARSAKLRVAERV